jgi:phosphoribosylformylglycinamidine cyclo-ligase
VALPSSGLHTNGYSLARKILFDRLGLAPTDPFPGADASIGSVLLRVHRSYLSPLRARLEAGDVVALAHVTGGGIPGNLNRVLPADADAIVELGTWEPPTEFRVLADESGLGVQDLYETLNMGVGMVAVVRPETVEHVLADPALAKLGAFDCGEVVAGSGLVRLVAAA